MPLVLAFHDRPIEAAAAVEAHLRLTHNSEQLVGEVLAMAGAVQRLLAGDEPRAVFKVAMGGRVIQTPLRIFH